MSLAVVYYTCQVHLIVLDCLSTGVRVLGGLIPNDSAFRRPRGRTVCDPAPVRGIGIGAASARARRPRDRVLHLAVADAEKGAPRPQPHGHLRPDGQVLEASERGT